ncbi:XRE family transcriptional regulator [Streptomyces armeniacus]|uniref:XRE family transcriptional regulator n=1 Tax=Streptomyces armeniacus TaxID=83291 RepID=A0A345XXM6_9ACTN|nr:helix-turn-helix transcriptional regulator [Streptomyces armeniacus]AXK36392.1 XRE family transcriptional regulator [Streptomyces armeniacus]
MVRLPLTPADIERGQRLGALLRQARGERSMLDVALAAGVSPETLRKIESGRVATPAFPTIAAIADVLGLSLDTVWAEISRPGGALASADSASSGRRGARERLAS